MGSYQNIFGGNTIDPADLGYVAYPISTSITLVWPFEAVESSDVAPAKISVTASVGGLSVNFPPANQASVGRDILVFNTGSNTFSVNDNSGGNIGSVASGQEWIFTLTTNATAAGTWIAAQLGTGTSSATAASLAGAGLRALLNKLDQNLPTTALNADHSIVQADRATLLKNTGGAHTWTFATAVTLGNGFFTYLKNDGTGIITIATTGGDTVDIDELAPNEGGIYFSDGVSSFGVVGHNPIFPTTISYASIDLSTQGGTGDFTLSAQDAIAQIQDFTGLITGNRSILYGGTPGYWFVFNNYTGAFTTTFKVDGGDTGVVVQQGDYAILRSNGTNMKFAAIPSGTQTITTTGTFTWPQCKGAIVTIIAPGGGGGRGIANGGSGGGGGGGARMNINFNVTPAVGTTTAVTINAPGVGATTTNTAGTAGGTVVFGTFGVVNGGLGGLADGLNNSVGGGSWGSSRYASAGVGIGGQGSASSGSGSGAEWGGGGGGSGRNTGSGVGIPGAGSQFGAGGGGGGGYNTPDAGGAGGTTGNISTSGGGGTGGIAGGTTGGAGGNGAAGTNGGAGSGGGGGGGGTGTGGKGGDGGLGGGGGGGGGFGVTTSGNGGNGGAGVVYVTWW